MQLLLWIRNPNNNITLGQSSTWKKLWKIKIHDRLKFFCRKILNNNIPTKAMLKRILLLNDDESYCPICKSEEETQTHLFFTRIIWRRFLLPLNISCLAENDISHWLECIISPSKSLNISSSDKHHFQIFAINTMNNIWFLRNKLCTSLLLRTLKIVFLIL